MAPASGLARRGCGDRHRNRARRRSPPRPPPAAAPASRGRRRAAGSVPPVARRIRNSCRAATAHRRRRAATEPPATARRRASAYRRRGPGSRGDQDAARRRFPGARNRLRCRGGVDRRRSSRPATPARSGQAGHGRHRYPRASGRERPTRLRSIRGRRKCAACRNGDRDRDTAPARVRPSRCGGS